MPPAVEGLSIELGTVNETLESRWGKRQLFTHSQTDGVLFLSVSPVLNGRSSMLSPTIILPLIQCLALLHWLPIGSCFGGMHWLHLPAARIPAFLNKALNPPCCWPGCPAPPLLSRSLDAKHELCWGATAYLMWQQHHTEHLNMTDHIQREWRHSSEFELRRTRSQETSGR